MAPVSIVDVVYENSGGACRHDLVKDSHRFDLDVDGPAGGNRHGVREIVMNKIIPSKLGIRPEDARYPRASQPRDRVQPPDVMMCIDMLAIGLIGSNRRARRALLNSACKSFVHSIYARQCRTRLTGRGSV